MKRGEEEIREEEKEKQRLATLATYIPSNSPASTSSSNIPSAATTQTPTSHDPTISPALDQPSPRPLRRGRIKPAFGSELSREKLKRLKEEIVAEKAKEGGPERLVIDGMEFEEEPFKEAATEGEAIATKSKMDVVQEKERILGAHVLSPVCLPSLNHKCLCAGTETR